MAVPIVIYNSEPKPHSWARWMVGRTMRKNNNNLISVIGKTGSGKTWSAIAICQIMSKMDGVPFDVDNIIFDLPSLMNLINSGKLKRGSKIVCDEFQCSIGAKDFQSQANKVFNYMLTTFRHLNLTLFFCTPFESLLDRSTRRLFHARFETLSIDRKRKVCRLKPRFLEYSDWKEKPYQKQMIINYKKDGMKKSNKLFHWAVPKPTPKLIEKYEAKKLEFTTLLNQNISARLNDYEESGKSITSVIKPPARKPLTDKQELVLITLAKYEGDVKKVSQDLSMSEQNIYFHINQSKKKDFQWEEFLK